MPRDDDDDNPFDHVESMAKRLGLKGKDRSQYIDEHMTGLGFERVQNRDSYARINDDDDNDGARRTFIPRSEGSNRRGGGRSRRRDDDDDSF